MELPEIRVYSASPVSADLPPPSYPQRSSVCETALNSSVTSKYRKASSTGQSPQLCNVDTDDCTKRVGKVRMKVTNLS